MRPDSRTIPFTRSVDISAIGKRIDAILANTRRHYDSEPVGDDFTAFVIDVHDVFPESISGNVIYSSLMDLAGKRLSRDIIKQSVWRLAGNMHSLKLGKPVPPWIHQTELEWVPVVILRATKGRGYNGDLGHFYEYRILAGSAAGLKFTTFWTYKRARFTAKSIGFKRTRKVYYRFTDGTELVQMRLYLLLDPELSKDGTPRSNHFHVPSSCVKHNQRILEQRYRITPCPKSYTLAEMPCYLCHQGYDNCAAACHPVTYRVQVCPRCMQEGWFDPLGRGSICVECEEKEGK